MKTKSKPSPRKVRSDVIEFRLPKEVDAQINRIAKFAGVPAHNVIKLAIAERLLRDPSKSAAPAAAPGQRFTKLDDKGKPTTGDHFAVYDAKTDLIWLAAPLQNGKEMNHAAALKACAGLDVFGHKDWRAPTIQELLSIVDYERCDPAVDAEYFKGPYSWTWSSTVAKAPSGFAWFVYLDDGSSYRSNQTYDFHVRAVRAGQPLGLGI